MLRHGWLADAQLISGTGEGPLSRKRRERT
jgi:hypothetical protein